ncbi:hypothetical protein TNCT_54211 [Trichonephila clavata]|uniref:Uncharacterized protein n=1 Tax=Trichonephila clavata TaxID=2740835 RepID=A0A8X6H050_TRICU|nr:hypothetical protein TNCT_54211 [Trichonephila clavata]
MRQSIPLQFFAGGLSRTIQTNTVGVPLEILRRFRASQSGCRAKSQFNSLMVGESIIGYAGFQLKVTNSAIALEILRNTDHW